MQEKGSADLVQLWMRRRRKRGDVMGEYIKRDRKIDMNLRYFSIDNARVIYTKKV